ncbi:MAG: cyclic nucleotide-binding domain-containing protein [Mariprofundales bacterium]
MSRGVLLTIERVIILKSVEMFSQTSEEALVHVAQILEEVSIPIGEPILRKGELGTSMYIIISGLVRVHDDEREFAQLGERSVFGELAALDPEPRSADITAIANTRLFRLHETALYELMAEHVDVTRGIIRVLCHRMRRMLHTAK